MYTADLVTTRAWFSDPLNPTLNPIVCGTVRSQARADAQDGEIRQYASGRRQGVTTPTTQTTWGLTLVGLSWAQWQVVLGWMRAGTTVLYRAVQGDRAFGVFYALSTQTYLQTSLNDGRAFSPTLTFTQLDYTEAV
jgi:hypothetical protein